MTSTPLAGIRVLEIGQVISAPYAGLLLAELGAEVVKVERPGTGDSARDPSVTGVRGVSATFVTLNRNKTSVALDLAVPAGRRVFDALLADTDVLLSNMTPAGEAAVGLDFAAVQREHPALVVCRILGSYSDRPDAARPSYDLTHQAATGFLMLGGAEGEPPVRFPIPIADLAVAQFCVNAVLACLLERTRSGRGDLVEVSMSGSLLSLLTYHATLALNEGVEPARHPTAHQYTAPWQPLRAADGHLVIAVRSEKFWSRLCAALGRDDLREDPRFRTNADRIAHRAELETVLEEVLGADTVAAWCARLAEHDVPSAPVRTVTEALEHEASQPRSLVRELDDAQLGPLRVVASPFRFQRLDVAAPASAPLLPDDTSA
jgi:crotonobetainyl-CoA:carnitine CoA-transferase CaiB-like acyl-CoA transferase